MENQNYIEDDEKDIPSIYVITKNESAYVRSTENGQLDFLAVDSEERAERYVERYEKDNEEEWETFKENHEPYESVSESEKPSFAEHTSFDYEEIPITHKRVQDLYKKGDVESSVEKIIKDYNETHKSEKAIHFSDLTPEQQDKALNWFESTTEWKTYLSEKCESEKKLHHSELMYDFHDESYIKWNTIDGTMKSYLEIDGKYFERSDENAPDYMLSEDASFSDIIDEEGENHYKDDPRITHFTSDTELDNFLIEKYDLKSEKEIEKEIYLITNMNFNTPELKKMLEVIGATQDEKSITSYNTLTTEEKRIVFENYWEGENPDFLNSWKEHLENKAIAENKKFNIEDVLTSPDEDFIAKYFTDSKIDFGTDEWKQEFFLTKERIAFSNSLQNENEFVEKNNITDEDEKYIHSDEFIEKFGDWEKAKRIQKLKVAENIITDNKVIFNGEDLSSTIDSLIENEDRKSIQSLEKQFGASVSGSYYNKDTDTNITLSNRNVTEISNHHYLNKEHIHAILLIPEIIEKGTYIGSVENEDKAKHPNIQLYQYFATGIKIGNDDYTAKSVIGVDSNKNCYYDQTLSTIEKGRLVDLVQEKTEFSNLSPLITQRETELQTSEAKAPDIYYDKRLISICQVPQMQYLDENLEPTKDSILAVKNGKLWIEKNGQNFSMHDANLNAIEVLNNSKMDLQVQMRFLGEEQSTRYEGKIPKDIVKALSPYGLKDVENISYTVLANVDNSISKPNFVVIQEFDKLKDNWTRDDVVIDDKKVTDAFNDFVKKSIGIGNQINKNIATNFVLTKLNDAGIDVITNKSDFNQILKSEKVLQKMTGDLSEFEKLTKQLEEQKEKKQELKQSINEKEKTAFEIKKEKDGKYVLTSFDNKQKKEESTEAINAGIAKYSTTPEFLDMYAQVGAVYSSYNEDIALLEEKSSIQNMVSQDGIIYGFAHEGKIYLDDDTLNSNVAVHEYVHLWGAYTQKTNPELWQKGKDIFENTSLWKDVKSDPHYADIADNDDLVLSEVHARICGNVAEKVLERIAREDGEITKDKVIDWDRETWNYLAVEIDLHEFKNITFESELTPEDLQNFLSMPMKDLINGKNISQEKIMEQIEINKIDAKSYINSLPEEKQEYIKNDLAHLNAEPFLVFQNVNDSEDLPSIMSYRKNDDSYITHKISDSGLMWGHYDIKDFLTAQNQAIARVMSKSSFKSKSYFVTEPEITKSPSNEKLLEYLIVAIGNNNEKDIEKYISMAKKDNKIHHILNNAMFESVVQKNEKVLKTLIENGADVSWCKEENGEPINILHYAASDLEVNMVDIISSSVKGNPEVLKQMLTQENFEGRTPLQVAGAALIEQFYDYNNYSGSSCVEQLKALEKEILGIDNSKLLESLTPKDYELMEKIKKETGLEASNENLLTYAKCKKYITDITNNPRKHIIESIILGEINRSDFISTIDDFDSIDLHIANEYKKSDFGKYISDENNSFTREKIESDIAEIVFDETFNDIMQNISSSIIPENTGIAVSKTNNKINDITIENIVDRKCKLYEAFSENWEDNEQLYLRQIITPDNESELFGKSELQWEKYSPDGGEVVETGNINSYKLNPEISEKLHSIMEDNKDIYLKKNHNGMTIEEAFFLEPKPAVVFTKDKAQELADFMSQNKEFLGEPNVNLRQAEVILKYLDNESYGLYVEGNKGNFYIYDKSEDFDGVGESVDNKKLFEMTFGQIDRAKDYEYSVFDENDISVLKENLYEFYEKVSPENGKKQIREDINVSSKSPEVRYIDAIKNILGENYNKSTQDILATGQKVLSSFDSDDKKVISKYLISLGANSEKKLTEILTDAISPKKEQKIKKEVVHKKREDFLSRSE